MVTGGNDGARGGKADTVSGVGSGETGDSETFSAAVLGADAGGPASGVLSLGAIAARNAGQFETSALATSIANFGAPSVFAGVARRSAAFASAIRAASASAAFSISFACNSAVRISAALTSARRLV